MDFDTAYSTLMSPTPYSQSVAAAMMRNFSTAASLMAASLRDGGSVANTDAGTSGAATQQQAEAHAQWFDQVAQNTAQSASQLDKLAAEGNRHQTTASTEYMKYYQAQQNADQIDVPGGHMVAAQTAASHQKNQSATVMTSAVHEWGGSYASYSAPTPPPVPSSGGAPSAGGGGYSGGGGGYTGGGGYSGGTYSGGSHHATTYHGSTGTLVGGTSHTSNPASQTPILPPGSPGSVEVGSDNGAFAGWFKDPSTGYFVDPTTGREFDPVTNRWIDPVTGKPFGDVTQYATSLQGMGGASTTAGLLANTSGAVGSSVGSFAGAGGGAFASLFTGGNLTGIAAGYGGMLPPSLATGSAATGSLFQQAGRSTALKSQVASMMLAREQAARSGRPYLPPTQAGGAGGGMGGGVGARRPGYLTAGTKEASLFSSKNADGRGRAAGAGVEEEGARSTGRGTRGPRGAAEGEGEGAAATGGRRSYLPPNQAGQGAADKKKKGANRPDWLVDDDVFAADDAPSGVLGH